MEFNIFFDYLLGFIVSLGYYRLFFTINRPTVRWRFFVMLAVVLLNRQICSAWIFHAGYFHNLKEPSIIVIIGSFFINSISLLICVLLGSNRLRAFVAAAFVFSIIYLSELLVINYTAAFVNLLFGTITSFEDIPQSPQRYYFMVFLQNLIVMCSCFMAARWLRKTQEKPPFKISVCFCLFFISFTIVVFVFFITTWLWNLLAFMPLSFFTLSLLGTLLLCIPLFAMYFYSRLTVHKEPVSAIPDTARAGYAQYIGQLSKRELEVIEAVLAGNVSQKELAASLNISVNTVKKHLQHIYQTTGTANMTALTVLFSGYSNNNPLRLKDTNMAC